MPNELPLTKRPAALRAAARPLGNSFPKKRISPWRVLRGFLKSGSSRSKEAENVAILNAPPPHVGGCGISAILRPALIVLALHSLGAVLRASPMFEDFAGCEACVRCHEKQYKLWKDSTHGRAGGKPGEAKIIARFDGQPIRFKDANVTPRVNAQGAYQFVVEQPGRPELEIDVDAVVGGGHMFGGGTQSFFHKFNDGTV